tara:strand:- start:123 stop:515 length:393 start_codon:yes stop_codon:yes gene_type:complete
MLSGYVNSSYVSWDKSSYPSYPADAKKIVSGSEGSRFRLFGIQWLPMSSAPLSAGIVGVQLLNGDPDFGGTVFFEDQLNQATGYGYQSIKMMSILPHGVMTTISDGVYARVAPTGSDLNVSFVSLTYQLG